MIESPKYNRAVAIWLVIGLIMLVGQIFIGGVTRLTGSGLSITKWDIVTGTWPPDSKEEWDVAFRLYQDTPQYKLINKGMSLEEFKTIYFWEYIHRLWARLMGFVFIIPMFYFWRKGVLTRVLSRGLLVVVALAALAASFGWIMVASGLIERPWVNAYKLSIHLVLGFSVFIGLYHVWYKYVYKPEVDVLILKERNWSLLIFLIVVFQVVLGGMMSGMKAAYSFTTWPSMNGQWIPEILLDGTYWTIQNFIQYDETVFMVALIQFAHRLNAYILLIISIIYIIIYYNRYNKITVIHKVLISLLVTQLCLGIWTLISFKTGIPVALGSMHQLGALALLTVAYHDHFLRIKRE